MEDGGLPTDHRQRVPIPIESGLPTLILIPTMAFVTIEDRVDMLEAILGKFISEAALINKNAEARMERSAQEMREFKDEMLEFKNEMLEFKSEMQQFKDEMRQARKDTDKKWGDLANKMGTIVEDILAPNVKRLSTEHFHFNGVDMRLRWNRQKPNKKGWEEFDLVAIGPDAVIAAEAKSSMNLETAEKVAAKMAGFAAFAPDLAHLRLIRLVGCWAIPPQVVDRLTELGIYAMQMGEETMQLSNSEALDGKYLSPQENCET